VGFYIKKLNESGNHVQRTEQKLILDINVAFAKGSSSGNHISLIFVFRIESTALKAARTVSFISVVIITIGHNFEGSTSPGET